MISNQHLNIVITEDCKLTPEEKGSIQCLWEVFGGTVNDQGYKTLDEHIGLIYGDSITLERQQLILQGLADKGFASDNVVFGVGSYTYQYNTRDTFGTAMKATWAEIDNQGVAIYKDPKTDSGVKKSAKGILQVHEVDGELVLNQECDHPESGLLGVIYENGEMVKTTTLSEIRARIESQL